MELLPKAISDKLPKLFEQAWLGEDAVIFIKYIIPQTNRAWHVTEYDSKDTFFGFMTGGEVELGYFSLREFSSAVIMDMTFEPATIREVKTALGKHE
ncbi:MAG: hypothetical protein PHS46_06850 [Candidatus Omnitrophica bacterium]|nr:hypothetical protein [Candidatus Omnitrophota bacterium]